jgi:thiamine-phosphate pyrophosphorylase
MELIVISPESHDPREAAAMGGFFAEGLARYHVRKPGWDEATLEAWLQALPTPWRPRIVLHQHQRLVALMGLGGAHQKDAEAAPGAAACSRSCHDLATLRRALAAYEYVFFGPVFPSISKAGHGPDDCFPWEELAAVLAAEVRLHRAEAFAIGGVTAERLERCHDLGFDGAAVIGAVWSATDPVRAYSTLRERALALGAIHHAS